MPKKEKDKEKRIVDELKDKFGDEDKPQEVSVVKERTILTSPLALNRNEVKRRILEGRKKVAR